MKTKLLLISLILTAALAWTGLPASATPDAPAPPGAAPGASGYWERIYEEPGAGAVQTLAVETDGKVHMVYANGWDTEPAYLYEDAAGWHKEKIPYATAAGALVLDSAGRAHVAYLATDGLRYALRDAVGWHSEIVNPLPAGLPALALDHLGRPLVAWNDAVGIRLATKSGGQWAMQTVYEGPAGAPLLVVDGADRPHLAFTVGTGLRYAYQDSGAWYRAFPAPLDRVEALHSLAIDGGGTTYLAHSATFAPVRDSYFPLKVDTKQSREWRSEELEMCRELGPCAPALASDGQGVLSVAYIHAFPFEVRYARRTGGVWLEEIVATSPVEPPPSVIATSLALEAAGRPTISYFDPDILGLAVVRWVETAPTPAPTPTPTFTPRPTQTPSLTCLTPTPAAPYTGNPPASGTIEKQVAHCADDTYVRVDTEEILYDFTYIRMGGRNGGAVSYVAGFLFRDVRAPKGADMVSAKLRLQPEGHCEGTTVEVSIAGELNGQSGDFNPNNWWPHLRPRTAARVPWSVPACSASPADSPDIAAIIEEIVALPDWKPGNNIAIFLDPAATTNAWIAWHAYDGKPTASARLSLSYAPK